MQIDMKRELLSKRRQNMRCKIHDETRRDKTTAYYIFAINDNIRKVRARINIIVITRFKWQLRAAEGVVKYIGKIQIHNCLWPLYQTDRDSRAIDTLISDAFALIARAIIEAPNNTGILRGFSAPRWAGYVTFKSWSTCVPNNISWLDAVKSPVQSKNSCWSPRRNYVR